MTRLPRATLGLALLAFVAVSAGAGWLGLSVAVDPLYSADSSTRLFDDFEGVTRADTMTPTITYAAGYVMGQSIVLPDTGATISYPDSWWIADSGGYVDSGTIELFFRPDSFLFDGDHSYGLLLTTDERAINPSSGGLPTLAVVENGGLSWAVSTGVGGYHEALYSSEPPLYPGQWYHIAATWGGGQLKLYVNDSQVAEASCDTVIRARPFSIGGSGTDAFARGLAARGRIDRFRISSGERAQGTFPIALDVRIDSPVWGNGVTRPFPVRYRAFASDSRQRTVDLYADTDGEGYNGTPLATNLPDSGSHLTGSGLADGAWFLYAVARAGTDSAFFYMPASIGVSASAQYPNLVDPVETAATVVTPVTASETFLTILLDSGGTTSGTLLSSADSIGTRANYTVTTRLASGDDTLFLAIWTKLPVGGVLVGLRSDTASIGIASLPRGITATPVGLTALGNTLVFLEFMDGNGSLIGDTATTRIISDSYVYSIEYRLSKRTTGYFADLGFDTSVGSGSFAFFYADTIGSAWIRDTTVTVSVVAGTLVGGINVRVSGITRDLPGALGFTSSSSATVSGSSSGGGCVLGSWNLPPSWQATLRASRDWLVDSVLGRILVAGYYLFFGLI